MTFSIESILQNNELLKKDVVLYQQKLQKAESEVKRLSDALFEAGKKQGENDKLASDSLRLTQRVRILEDREALKSRALEQLYSLTTAENEELRTKISVLKEELETAQDTVCAMEAGAGILNGGVR